METTTSATGRKRPAPKGRRKTARDLSERDERGSICSGSCDYLLAAGDVLAPKVRAVQRKELAVRFRNGVSGAPLRYRTRGDAVAQFCNCARSAEAVDEIRSVHCAKYRVLNRTKSSLFDRV